MREVDGDAQIGIINRGNGSEIATFNEQGVHSLLSGNLMDVCPVGAITTRQYRFRSRPWDNPHAVDTTCTLCSKGCSTTAWLKAKPEWAKGSRLVRITPRYNPAVNDFWMCDIGRFQYLWVEGDERLRKPTILTKDGVQQVATWKDALMRVRDLLNAAGRKDPASVRMLASAHAVARGAVPAEAARRRPEGRGRRLARARGVAAHREAAAGEHQVPRARDRCAQRHRRARPRPGR